MCPDSQEVGLEAAILKRKRNSSLVKWICAENVRGLKPPTEARDNVDSSEFAIMVGERSVQPRRAIVRSRWSGQK
jgi:hypothetical protein